MRKSYGFKLETHMAKHRQGRNDLYNAYVYIEQLEPLKCSTIAKDMELSFHVLDVSFLFSFVILVACTIKCITYRYYICIYMYIYICV